MTTSIWTGSCRHLLKREKMIFPLLLHECACNWCPKGRFFFACLLIGEKKQQLRSQSAQQYQFGQQQNMERNTNSNFKDAIPLGIRIHSKKKKKQKQKKKNKKKQQQQKNATLH